MDNMEIDKKEIQRIKRNEAQLLFKKEKTKITS